MRDYGLEKLVHKTLNDAGIRAGFVRQSGALHAGEDVFTNSCMIQCKETTKTSYSIQYNDIIRLYGNTISLKKKHAIFIVRISVGKKPSLFVYECVQSDIVKQRISDDTVQYYRPYNVIAIGTLDEFVSNYTRFK